MAAEARIVLSVSEKFELERAVCNHGFFMMAPNLWDPSKKSLVRPLRLNSNPKSSVIIVDITQPLANNILLIRVTLLNQQPPQLSSQERQAIKDQVARMLRISREDEMMVDEFHKVHPRAKELGFARIFRSPTLFEDIVKSVLLCNTTWSRSLEMAKALCDLKHELGKIRNPGAKRLKRSDNKCMGNFPSPKEIACLDEETLNRHCSLGYRASIIIQVARDVEIGRLDMAINNYDDYKSFHDRLLRIKGFGPFTIANIMMCVGYYQLVPVDTETIKHLEKVHGKIKIDKKATDDVVEQIYGKYAPFQCLVYWMERVEYYEKMLGKLSELPHSQYCNVTTTKL